jgi:phosphoglycerate dehydrogenase-like enzyme
MSETYPSGCAGGAIRAESGHVAALRAVDWLYLAAAPTCLQPFDIVCVMRERTPMTRSIIERLPKIRMIASTATRNASIDLKAAEERGIQVVHTGYTSAPTIELTWALILASARNLVAENASLRGGGWQQACNGAVRSLWVMGGGPGPRTHASAAPR